ncbi:hypothetical protein F2Q69_00034052 [Brassica cretica]|uniref:Uncharacterized protein n=1 Tax=Brassica cretica TaxID=69181 RepID=A0A8S9SKA8_BRACR|nr:hypothetical protein F2Q69_00034052 [Brassica cretica]
MANNPRVLCLPETFSEVGQSVASLATEGGRDGECTGAAHGTLYPQKSRAIGATGK